MDAEVYTGADDEPATTQVKVVFNNTYDRLSEVH